MREAVGSSPSVSTTSLRTAYRSQRLFCKSHFSLILSQLLSESNPLSLGFDSVFYLNGVSFLSMLYTSSRTAYRLRRRFFISKQTPSLIHSVAPPIPPQKPPALRGDTSPLSRMLWQRLTKSNPSCAGLQSGILGVRKFSCMPRNATARARIPPAPSVRKPRPSLSAVPPAKAGRLRLCPGRIRPYARAEEISASLRKLSFPYCGQNDKRGVLWQLRDTDIK